MKKGKSTNSTKTVIGDLQRRISGFQELDSEEIELLCGSKKECVKLIRPTDTGSQTKIDADLICIDPMWV